MEHFLGTMSTEMKKKLTKINSNKKCNTKVAIGTIGKVRNLNSKSKMYYAEVRTKDGCFYNFVENIIKKKSYDRSCIS